MNTAHYEKYPRYPLSIESLSFIQEQIKLIYNISDLYGTNYILRQPTSTREGVLIKDGEVLPIQIGSPAEFIVIKTKPNDVTADGQDFQEIETG